MASETLEVIRMGTEDEIFVQLATSEQVLKDLSATMPFARVHLAEREERKRNHALRAAYALWWRKLLLCFIPRGHL